MIQPKLVIVTGIRNHIQQAVSFLEARGIPWMRPWENPIRLRTDGHVWVVDRMPGL